MNAVLADIDAAPVAVCRCCQRDMTFTWLMCATCIADGRRPNASDELSRNRRVSEVILWS